MFEETFSELFARLECASNFDGNPENVLHVALILLEGEVWYNPAMMPTVIGLHGAFLYGLVPSG